MRSTTRRRHRAFTLVELAVVMAVSAGLVPLIYAGWRQIEHAQVRALQNITAATSTRTVSEVLRRDLSQGAFVSGEDVAVRLPCGTVRYVVVDHVLRREGDGACGGTQAIAQRVSSWRRLHDGVEMTFSRTDGLPATFVIAAARRTP